MVSTRKNKMAENKAKDNIRVRNPAGWLSVFMLSKCLRVLFLICCTFGQEQNIESIK